jgi:ABC-type branched-subunit amino acid transport system substrate-binding protein
MKKVMILYSRIAESMPQHVLKGLEDAGFVDQSNLMSVQVLVSGNTDLTELLAQVQEVAPDVIINVGQFGQIVAALKELPLPI